MNTQSNVLSEALEQIVNSAVEKALSKISIPSQKPDEDLLDIQGAADLLGLKTSTLYVKASRREIDYFKKFGRLYFSKKHLLSLIESGKMKNKTDFQKILDKQFALKK